MSAVDQMSGRRFFPLIPTVVAAAATVALFIALGGLSDELRKDEQWFWPATVFFSHRWVPTLEELRSYPRPNTPLQFLIVGAIEHATGRGLIIGRAINAILAVGLIAVIAAGRNRLSAALAAFGLLLFPYYLGVSVYYYTDTMPTALAAIGVLAHLRGRCIIAAICMALAIACRQYMVAFGLGLCAWEGWSNLRAGRGPFARARAWAPHVAAAATLGGWYLLFGGVAPAGSTAGWHMVTEEPGRVMVRNSLYSLTCVGAYFVLIEAVLFRRWTVFQDIASVRGIAIAAGLGLLFFVFPPLRNIEGVLPTMGYLDRAAVMVLGDVPRMVAYWALAVLAAVRFRPAGPAFWLVMANAAMMMKAHLGWDKYAMALLAALWLLASRDACDGPAESAAGSTGES